MLTMILEMLRGLAGGNGLADRYTYGDVYGLWYRLNESVLGGEGGGGDEHFESGNTY